MIVLVSALLELFNFGVGQVSVAASACILSYNHTKQLVAKIAKPTRMHLPKLINSVPIIKVPRNSYTRMRTDSLKVFFRFSFVLYFIS